VLIAGWRGESQVIVQTGSHPGSLVVAPPRAGRSVLPTRADVHPGTTGRRPGGNRLKYGEAPSGAAFRYGGRARLWARNRRWLRAVAAFFWRATRLGVLAVGGDEAPQPDSAIRPSQWFRWREELRPEGALGSPGLHTIPRVARHRTGCHAGGGATEFTERRL
jgi:hypothetical protein